MTTSDDRHDKNSAAIEAALSREQLLAALVQAESTIEALLRASRRAPRVQAGLSATQQQTVVDFATIQLDTLVYLSPLYRATLARAEAAEARVRELERDANHAAQALIYAVQKHPMGDIGQDWSSWRVGFSRGVYRGYGRTDLQQLVSAVCQATEHADPYDPTALGSPS